MTDPEKAITRQTPSRVVFWVLAGVAFLAPYCWAFARIEWSRLADGNYWFLLLQLHQADGSPNPAGFFAVFNEQYLILPKLIYALNMTFTGGSNSGLIQVALVLSFLCGILLLIMITRAMPERYDWTRLGAILGTAMALTAPAAGYLLMNGSSGVAWFSGFLLAFISLTLLTWAWQTRGRSRVWMIATAGFIGAAACLTHGSGFAVVPAMMLTCLVARRPRKELLYLTPWLAISLLILISAQIAGTGSMPVRNPVEDAQRLTPILQLPVMMLSLIGGLFTSHFGIAVGLGVLGGAAFAGLVYVLFSRAAQVSSPTFFFLALAIFAGTGIALVCTANLAQATNYVFGESRFYALPGLFWMGLAVCAACVILEQPGQLPKRWNPEIAGAIVPVLVILAMFAKPIPSWEIRSIQKQHAEVYLRLGLLPELRDTFPNRDQGFDELLGILYRQKHFPFNDSYTLHRHLGGPAPETVDSMRMPAIAMQRTNAGLVRVQGEVIVPFHPHLLEVILLADHQGTIIGAATTGFEKLLPEDQRPAPGVHIFRGALRPKPYGIEDFDAYARSLGSSKFYLLVPETP